MTARLPAALSLLLLSSVSSAHPLDSLTAGEIRSAAAVLREEGAATQATRFAHMRLAPPAKEEVWRWQSGPAPARVALVTLRDGTTVSEAVVDLARKQLVRVTRVPNVQTNIVPEEWARATALVKADPRWRAAMRARGIDDFTGIFCDALSVGSFGSREQRRLLRVPCYDARGTRNVYGRPIEGLMALVDIAAGSVLEVSDSGVVPLSTADPSLEQERQPLLRPSMKPVVSSAPAGFNFSIDGGIVRWGPWSFHVGFDQRVGPIVSTVRHRDGDRERPVLYQGHISEMFVPYMDADPNWSFRSYMDVGEYGFGSLASQLVPGSDCPTGAVMVSAILANQSGEPYRVANVMCAFERNTTTPLWRRSEIVTASHEARQDVELVIRTIPAVGNYDYIYDWVFNLKGEIRIDVGATGIAAAKGVNARRADQLRDQDNGTLVGANLIAPYHDHFLSFRLDLDVDGPKNRFVREHLVQQALPAGNPRRSLWARKAQLVPTEFSAAVGHEPELWRVESEAATTALGYPTSFRILGDHMASSLLSPSDPPQERAAFSSRPLWVTRYRPAEQYAAGDYPNQSSGGEGLPQFVNGEAIAGKDIVLWYTMGFHHVTRPEDWPVLPTVRHSVTLRPHRFFDRNPAMDLPREFTRAEN